MFQLRRNAIETAATSVPGRPDAHRLRGTLITHIEARGEIGARDRRGDAAGAGAARDVSRNAAGRLGPRTRDCGALGVHFSFDVESISRACTAQDLLHVRAARVYHIGAAAAEALVSAIGQGDGA